MTTTTATTTRNGATAATASSRAASSRAAAADPARELRGPEHSAQQHIARRRLPRLGRRLAALFLVLTSAVALTAVSAGSASAVSQYNGVINAYGYGKVFSPSCTGSYLNSEVDMMAGNGTTALAFRYWFRPTTSTTWTAAPWHTLYNVRPNVMYTLPLSVWNTYDESIPRRGSGAYVVAVEFDFLYGGAWRSEMASVTGFYGTYGVTNYTGPYCWSQQW